MARCDCDYAGHRQTLLFSSFPSAVFALDLSPVEKTSSVVFLVAAVQPSGTNRHREVCRRRSLEMGALENPTLLSSVVLGLQALGHEALRTVSLACNSQSLTAAWGSRLLGSSQVSVVYGDRRTMMLEFILSHYPKSWSGVSLSCPHPDISTPTGPFKQVLGTTHKFSCLQETTARVPKHNHPSKTTKQNKHTNKNPKQNQGTAQARAGGAVQ